jgi:Xaa-Pro aminopeptidase
MPRFLIASSVCAALISGAAVVGVATQAGRPQFSQAFTREEFAGRRARIAETIGPRAVALVQGAPSVHSSAVFRQSNEFFYVTGVTVPQSYLLIDGASKKSTLYLPPRDERRAATEGDLLTADDAAAVVALTGIEQVHPLGQLAQDVKGMSPAPAAIYTPFQPAEGDAESRDGARRKNADAAADPWDGRQPREERFIELIKSRVPGAEVKDLSPALDAMRALKSSQELAVIERATKIGGDAIVEAMRSTQPGVREAELDALARFIYVRNGAQGEAYRAIVASGPSAMNQHHRASERVLPAGELVVMDYCPDVSYYRCDVTRTWPVDGKFKGWQRELYGFYNASYEAILYGIKPNVTAKSVLEGAIVKMDALLGSTKFSKPEYRKAAEAFVDQFRRSLASPRGGSLGHAVGMSTHDMGGGTGTLTPGLVFTIEPALRVPEENVYIRSEDMIVITPTAARILSDWVPRDMSAIEKVMAEPGLLQRYPGGTTATAMKSAPDARIRP